MHFENSEGTETHKTSGAYNFSNRSVTFYSTSDLGIDWSMPLTWSVCLLISISVIKVTSGIVSVSFKV